jgi:MFS family permease
VLAGCSLTVSIPLFQRLFPRAKFNQFLSASNLVAGLTYVTLPPALGLFLDASGHAYRYTFLLGGILSTLAFFALLGVNRNFNRLGESKNNVAV